MDAVSEVLIARAPKNDGLNSMLGASVMAHVVIVGIFIFLPAGWLGSREQVEENVLQISIGGPVGPDPSGLTSMTARTIQQVQTELPKAVEPVRPPQAETPEMVEPTKAPPKKVTPNKVDAKDPKSNRPTKGEEIRKGSSIADSPNRNQGFGGLSSGGGGTGAQVEAANFCCPEYLATMTASIKSNFAAQQNVVGMTRMRFVVRRDGSIVDITVLQTSGAQALDFVAERALKLTKLPPLPAGYTESTLGVRLEFVFSR